MSSGRETARGTLASPTFSFVANRGVGLVAVVSVLLFATVSLKAALIGIAAFSLYFYVVYDVAYHAASKRLDLGTKSDFVLRVVVLLAGGIAIPKLLVLPNTEAPALLSFLGFLDAPLGLALAVGGALLTLEGLGRLRKRMSLTRATPYVGQEIEDGRVSLQGTARPRDTDEVAVTDGGQTDDDRRIMTDGGQPQGAEEDPFDDTPFEPIEEDTDSAKEDVSPFDPGPSPFDDEAETSTPESSGGTIFDHPEEEKEEADTETADEETDSPRSAIESAVASMGPSTDVRVDPADVDGVPVAVDGETSRVVATKSDCTKNGWRKAIANWLGESFEREHGVDLRRDPKALGRMVSVADRARDDLAERPETEVLLPFIAEVDGQALHVRRSLVAVDEDGTPRTDPPFEGAIDTEEVETPDVEQSEDVDADDIDLDVDADEEQTVDPETPEETTVETDAVEDDDPSAVVDVEDETEPSVDVESEAEETTETVDEGALTVEAPGTGREALAHRFKRRGKVRRPAPLQKVPVDGSSVDALVPDAVELGTRVPEKVPGSGLLPDQVGLPSVPDVFEDDEDEPGVRWMANRESDGVVFDVESFGTVRVDAGWADVLASTDAAGTDGPGFWYESSIEPGDTVTVVGETMTRSDADVDVRVGGTSALVADGEITDVKSSLGRGGLIRLAVGLPMLGAGASMTTASLPAGVTSAALPVGAVLGAVFAYRNRESVAPAVREKWDATVEWVADRIHETQTERSPEGRIRGAVHKARSGVWNGVATAVEEVARIDRAVEHRRN